MTERAVDSTTETKPLAESVSALEDRLRPDLFRALGDPTRLEVLGRLITASGPQTVGQVAGCCGVHLSGVSRHLAVLRDAGIVDSERRGREVLYRLETEPLTRALRDLADAIDACRRACCGGSGCGEPETGEHQELER